MANGIVLSYGQSKHEAVSKVITTLADVGAGNMAILIGTSVPLTQQDDIYTKLREAADTVREQGFPKAGTTGNYVGASGALNGAITFSADDAAIATPVETEVALVYNDSFPGTPFSTALMDATKTTLLEVYLETVAVVN